MTLNRSFLTLFLTFFKGLQSLSGFAFGILLSKVFGLDFYGTYFKILKYIQLSTLISLIGYPNLLARSVTKKERSRILTNSLLISLPISSLIFSIIFYLEFSPLSDFIIFVCYILLIFNIFSKQYEALELSNINPWKGSFINLSLIHGIIFIIIYSLNLFNFNISKNLIFGLMLTLSVISLAYILYKFKSFFFFSLAKPNVQSFLSSFYVFSGKINTIIITKLDIVLLSAFFTVEEIGLYAIASRIPSLGEVSSNAIRSNTIGVFSRNFEQKNFKQFLKIFIDSLIFSILIIFLLCLFFIFTFNYIMNIFDLNIQLSKWVLFLYILPSSLNILFSQIGTIINVTKNEKYLFKASILSIPFVIMAMTLGAYLGTLETFLIGLSSSILIVNSFKLYYAKKIYYTYFKI